jgi:hypothetical protein
MRNGENCIMRALYIFPRVVGYYYVIETSITYKILLKISQEKPAW